MEAVATDPGADLERMRVVGGGERGNEGRGEGDNAGETEGAHALPSQHAARRERPVPDRELPATHRREWVVDSGPDRVEFPDAGVENADSDFGQ